MNIEISVTKENTITFPIHSHSGSEYMLYTKGSGILKTEIGDYPFSEGTLIAIPPNVFHGSVSDKPFVNICIHNLNCNFANFDDIIYIKNSTAEIKALFELIKTIFFNSDYSINVLSYLISALTNLIQTENPISRIDQTVLDLHGYITENFQSADCNIIEFQNSKGYSDDYCRIKFNDKYGLTPYKYLIKLRMEYSKTLLDTYGKMLKISEISLFCGYQDPLYFSRQFKKHFNASPALYIKRKEDKNEKI